MNEFSSFGLEESILKAIKNAGFKEPSPIQKSAIPIVLQGHDIVAQAQTGTGKTAAFSLPILSKIDPSTNKTEVLVITPTRELATQVSDEMYMFGKHKDIRTITVYGGTSYKRQIDMINKGVSVVVATPGRMIDLLKNGKLRNFSPSVVILDEADEMLDMGFLEDIKEIFTHLPEKRQSMLFSATMPEPIKKLANKILKEPKIISVTPKHESTNEDIEQYYYVINEYEREMAMLRLLDSIEPSKAVIFCRTKKEVDTLATKLVASGYSAKGLHGDMEQPQREEVIRAFKEGQIDLLVATDVAARGIHVNSISHVFNFHIPFDPDSYVHRIGRTGRAGEKGIAITLCTPLEYHSMQRIAKKVGTKITRKNIPTLKDVNLGKLDKTAKSIKDAPLLEEASVVLNALEEDMSLAKIALKAISTLLEQKGSRGPENIGLNQKALEKLLKSSPRNDSGRGNNRRRRRSGGRNDNRRGGERNRGQRRRRG
ncbi:MAG: DEAD/DEAH box helicase [Campylobacteraceae bacterium]|nr:DEAD/DEAH box helicase [Campylobacteraceae bacterium]